MIKVGDMVRQMRLTTGLNKPRPFSVVYCTADRKRDKGGSIREIRKAVLLTKQRTPDRTLNLQPYGTTAVVRVHLDLIIYFNEIEVA